MAIHMLTVVVLPAIADADLQPLQLKTEPPVCVEEGGSHKSGIEVLWWSHRTRYNRASGGGGWGGEGLPFCLLEIVPAAADADPQPLQQQPGPPAYVGGGKHKSGKRQV